MLIQIVGGNLLLLGLGVYLRVLVTTWQFWQRLLSVIPLDKEKD